MAMSGIKMDPEAVNLFKEIMRNKAHKYAVFKISDDEKNVVIDFTGDKIKTESLEEDARCWQEMISSLKNSEPRFLVFDFRFPRKDGVMCEKIGFFLWSHDQDCRIKPKMLYGSTKEEVKKAFKGYHYEVQGPISECNGGIDYYVHQAAVEKLRK